MIRFLGNTRLFKAKLYINSEEQGGKTTYLNHKLGFFPVLCFKDTKYYTGRIYFYNNDNVFYPNHTYDVEIAILLEKEFFDSIDNKKDFFVAKKPESIFGKIIIEND